MLCSVFIRRITRKQPNTDSFCVSRRLFSLSLILQDKMFTRRWLMDLDEKNQASFSRSSEFQSGFIWGLLVRPWWMHSLSWVPLSFLYVKSQSDIKVKKVKKVKENLSESQWGRFHLEEEVQCEQGTCCHCQWSIFLHLDLIQLHAPPPLVCLPCALVTLVFAGVVGRTHIYKKKGDDNYW